MMLNRKTCKDLLVLACASGCLSAAPAFAQGTSAGREIPYPTEYEIQFDSNGGVVAIPTKFAVRQVGVRTNVKSIGVVKLVRGTPGVVKLTLNDGRSVLTKVGKQLKLDGELYQVMGWRNGTYVMKGMKNKKTLTFKPSG